MSNATEKAQRLQHANELIRIIGSYGRRFFYYEEEDRYSYLKIDERGRVWYVDHYTRKSVYTHRTGFSSRWRGAALGGTLRNFVEQLRDYVVHGKKIPNSWLGPEGEWTGGNVWGYESEAMNAVRDRAAKLPVVREVTV